MMLAKEDVPHINWKTGIPISLGQTYWNVMRLKRCYIAIAYAPLNLDMHFRERPACIKLSKLHRLLSFEQLPVRQWPGAERMRPGSVDSLACRNGISELFGKLQPLYKGSCTNCLPACIWGFAFGVPRRPSRGSVQNEWVKSSVMREEAVGRDCPKKEREGLLLIRGNWLQGEMCIGEL